MSYVISMGALGYALFDEFPKNCVREGPNEFNRELMNFLYGVQVLQNIAPSGYASLPDIDKAVEVTGLTKETLLALKIGRYTECNPTVPPQERIFL